MDLSQFINDNTDVIEKSLSGHMYDIAVVFHTMFKDRFACDNFRKKMWFEFRAGSHQWSHTELGPFLVISTEFVSMYEAYHELIKNSIHSAEQTIEQQKLASINGIIAKLKTVTFKENFCKECYYLFFNPHFISSLDTNTALVCFRNGVLNTLTNEFRDGRPSDMLLLYINSDYDAENIEDIPMIQSLIIQYNRMREDVLHKRQRGKSTIFG
jgi:hypothetical protein